MTHTLKVLSANGDDVAATWDPAVKEEVDVAEVEFDRLSKNMMAFTDTVPAEQVTKFDPPGGPTS